MIIKSGSLCCSVPLPDDVPAVKFCGQLFFRLFCCHLAWPAVFALPILEEEEEEGKRSLMNHARLKGREEKKERLFTTFFCLGTAFFFLGPQVQPRLGGTAVSDLLFLKKPFSADYIRLHFKGCTPETRFDALFLIKSSAVFVLFWCGGHECWQRTHSFLTTIIGRATTKIE